MKKIIFTLVLFVFTFSFLHSYIGLDDSKDAIQASQNSKKTTSASSNKTKQQPKQKLAKAPDFEVKDIEGKNFKLSDFKGKVLILDFWATWCPPCIEEIPGFNNLYSSYQKDGLEIIGLSLDNAGEKVVKDFVAKNSIKYKVAMGNAEIADNYGGITGIPTTFIINKNGEIASKHIGFTSKADFEKEIKKLL